MQIAHFTAIRRIEIADVPAPNLRYPGDVLLRIDRVGVCGSDVHYYLDGRIGDQIVQYPATLGHECSGTVLEVGSAVQGVKPGDRVAVDPAISCGICDQCRGGRANTCRKIQFMGCPGEALGAAAEYQVLPGANCFPIPRAMSLNDAALVEPLSIGLYAARMAGLQAAEEAEQAVDQRVPRKVAVLGAGPIGLSVMLCAKALGACTLYATDLLDERLEAARRCGADWTGNPRRDDPVASIASQEPQGVDLVFECSGDPACVDQAQRLLTPGGTLLLVGIPPLDQISFDPHRMRRAELTFRAVRRQSGCVAAVIELISQGRIDPSPLLTHHFTLPEIGEAFELVAGYRDGVIKAMVRFTEAD